MTISNYTKQPATANAKSQRLQALSKDSNSLSREARRGLTGKGTPYKRWQKHTDNNTKIGQYV